MPARHRVLLQSDAPAVIEEKLIAPQLGRGGERDEGENDGVWAMLWQPHAICCFRRCSFRRLTMLQLGCSAAADAADDDGRWEARCVLLLWLAILVLIPFDLATIDSRQGLFPFGIGCAMPAIPAYAPRRCVLLLWLAKNPWPSPSTWRPLTLVSPARCACF